MKKLLIFAIMMALGTTCLYAENNGGNESNQSRELHWNSFARKHAHLTFFYNTVGFTKESFTKASYANGVHNGARYGAGIEFTTNAYIGGIIRESVDFGFQDDFAWGQLMPGAETKKWYLSTEIGPSLNFFFTDHISLSIPFLWSFRYGGNANEFYNMTEKQIAGKDLQFHMTYMMTPSVIFYLKHLAINVGLNFEITPKGEKIENIEGIKDRVANLGLHLGIGLGH